MWEIIDQSSLIVNSINHVRQPGSQSTHTLSPRASVSHPRLCFVAPCLAPWCFEGVVALCWARVNTTGAPDGRRVRSRGSDAKIPFEILIRAEALWTWELIEGIIAVRLTVIVLV
jgi:hypothetical protein